MDSERPESTLSVPRSALGGLPLEEEEKKKKKEDEPLLTPEQQMRMDRYVANTLAEYQNHSDELFHSGIDRDCVFSEELDAVFRRSKGRAHYIPFRGISVNLFEYATSAVHIPTELRMDDRNADVRFRNNVRHIVQTVRSNILFTDDDMRQLTQYTNQLEAIVENGHLTSSELVNAVEPLITETLRAIAWRSTGNLFEVHLFRRTRPELIMRTITLYVLSVDDDESILAYGYFWKAFYELQCYLRCYPEESAQMEFIFRVASCILCKIEWDWLNERNHKQRLDYARSLFRDAPAGYDLELAKQNAERIRAIRFFVNTEPWADKFKAIKTSSVHLAENLGHHVGQSFHGFWKKTATVNGKTRYYMDVLEYFRAVALHILHTRQAIESNDLGEIERFVWLCQLIPSWHPAVITNLETNPILQAFFQKKEEIFKRINDVEKRYILWQFCLDQPIHWPQ